MNDLMAGLASQINEQHIRAVEHAGKAVEHARQCGELLIEAKAQLDHGEWLPWIAANCQFSERTSQAYMRVAKNWTAISKSAAIADLPLREALKYLAGPKVGDEPLAPEKGDPETGESEISDPTLNQLEADLLAMADEVKRIKALMPEDISAHKRQVPLELAGDDEQAAKECARIIHYLGR